MLQADPVNDYYSRDHDGLDGFWDWAQSTGESIYNAGKSVVSTATESACDAVRSGIVQQAAGYSQYAPNAEAQSAGKGIQYGTAACNALYPPDVPPLPQPSGSGAASALVARMATGTMVPSYPKGSIAAFDPKLAKYRIAAPVAGLSGFGAAAFRQVATSSTVPTGVRMVTMSEFESETGTRPWYKSWKTYAIAGGVAVVGVGGYMLLR